MKRSLPALVILFGLLAIFVQVSPAQAQATRTWVSGVGDDANPCSRTAPCKTFAGAISKTAAGGSINVLDPGGFGAVTITKSITIRSDHFEAGVLVSGTNGIIVNLPNATDKVLLEGLDIEGIGTGLDGVKIIGTGRVFIRKTVIRNFTGNGVNVVGTANARAYIADCFITGNGGGVNVAGVGGVANFGFVINTVIDSNPSFSLQVNGATNSVSVSGSTLTGSSVAFSSINGGVINSFGPSNVATGSGAPTSTTAFK